MALGQTRVSGSAQAVELAGRDLKWIKVSAITPNIETNASVVNSDFEGMTKGLMQFGSITILGTPAAGNVMVAMEGCEANAATLQTAVRAQMTGNTTAIVTVYDGLSGITFA